MALQQNNLQDRTMMVGGTLLLVVSKKLMVTKIRDSSDGRGLSSSSLSEQICERYDHHKNRSHTVSREGEVSPNQNARSRERPTEEKVAVTDQEEAKRREGSSRRRRTCSIQKKKLYKRTIDSSLLCLLPLPLVACLLHVP